MGSPSIQNRHGTSAAAATPTRGPDKIFIFSERAVVLPVLTRSGEPSVHTSAPSSDRSMPSAWQSLAGPRARSRAGTARRPPRPARRARARRTRDPIPEGRARITSRDLARGPARLCQALGIDRSLDGADVCAAGSPLRVRAGAGNPARSAGPGPGDDPPEPPRKIVTGPRVGVSSAAEIPWRFWYEGDPTVSVYRAHVPRRPKLVTP